MKIEFITILLTILGGLVVTGIVSWIRKSALVLLVPRMFSYSQITDRGQLIELTVFNRGFKTEESVEITLNPMLRYEILGSNSQDVIVEKNKVKISRIGSSDEVTSLLIVENGVFKKDDITQCLSKETRGRVVDKLEEVPLTGPQRINFLVVIILLALSGYAFTYGIDHVLERLEGPVAKEETASKVVEIAGWKILKVYANQRDSFLFEKFSNQEIRAELEAGARKNNLVGIKLRIVNNTDQIIRISSAEMITMASEKIIPSYERSIYDVLVLPKKAVERSVNVVIPKDKKDLAENIVFAELFLTDTNGDSLKLNTELLVE